MTDETPTKFDPLHPCLHCAIGRLVAMRQKCGLPDDDHDILHKLCETIAEVCATGDQPSDRRELIAFAATLLRGMWHDVIAMKWKTDNARSDQTNDKRH